MRIFKTFCIRSLPPRSAKGRAAVLGALGIVLAAALLLSLRSGSRNLSAVTLLHALLSGERESTVWRILVHVRLPRTLACLLAGSALAVSGALIQAVLDNPMASPNVIGVNAGAGFCTLLAAALVPQIPALVPAAAFAGALGATLIIYLLALRAGFSRTTLILAGVAISGMLTAGVNTVTLLWPDIAIGSTGFMMGGFSGVTLSAVRDASGYIAAGLVLAGFLAEELNVLGLGEESAAGLGLAVGRTRFLAVLAASLLAGAAVSFAGLLSFVGLLVPHMVRRLIGEDNVWLLPACALSGAAFVLLCDVAARVLFAPFEVPVGIILSLLGGPFLLSLLLRRRGRGRGGSL